MSDPFNHPPGTNPPRHIPIESSSRWIFVAIAFALLIGVGLWEFSNRQDRSASNEPATVGRSERAPAPAPANPSGTAPQPGPDSTR